MPIQNAIAGTRPGKDREAGTEIDRINYELHGFTILKDI
jgi:hypothetical protein